MDKIMEFMKVKFTPVVNKITKNVWVSSVQDSMMTILPLILVGSLVTVVSLLNNIFPGMPDLSLMNTFTFGLLGLFVAFLIPYFVMEKKGYDNKKIISGATAISLYMLLLNPNISEAADITFVLGRFGATGMFLSIVVGMFVGFVMSTFSKHSFFDEDSLIPDFVVTWFDSLLPITLIMLVGWLISVPFNLDFFDIILKIFQPLASIVQTYPGFVLSVFIPVVMYTFGVSGWVVMPVIYPVYLSGLAENAENVAKGLEATNVATQETIYAFSSMGGVGTTLALAFLLAFFSKSIRLKAIGKATFVPSLFNINEPMMFGAPVVFNPYLMVPMWINGLVVPSIVYLVMKMGVITIPTKTFLLWYCPYPLASYLATQDWRAIIMAIAIFVLTFIIFYPFFKVYDNQILKEEQNN